MCSLAIPKVRDLAFRVLCSATKYTSSQPDGVPVTANNFESSFSNMLMPLSDTKFNFKGLQVITIVNVTDNWIEFIMMV